MARKEFTKNVETEGTEVSVNQSGSVDVSDDTAREMGIVEQIRQAINVDDSTPIDVNDTSGGGSSSPEAVEKVELFGGDEVASGDFGQTTISPPAGEVWNIKFSYIQIQNTLSNDASSGTSTFKIALDTVPNLVWSEYEVSDLDVREMNENHNMPIDDTVTLEGYISNDYDEAVDIWAYLYVQKYTV